MKFQTIAIIILALLSGNLSAENIKLNLAKEKEVFFTKIFNTYDKNSDEKLSVEEYLVYLEEQPKKNAQNKASVIINKCDKNKNGTIDKNELTQKDKMFSKASLCPLGSAHMYMMDKNKDNIITKKEIVNSYLKPKKTFGYEYVDFYRSGLKNFLPQERVAIALNQCDGDNNKKLTIKEAITCQLDTPTFKEFDKNKDGIIERKDVIYYKQKKLFSRIDQNSNKTIEKEEFFNANARGQI